MHVVYVIILAPFRDAFLVPQVDEILGIPYDEC